MAIIKKDAAKKTVYDVSITRAYQFSDGSIVFDMIVNGISLYSCTIRESRNGNIFISFPSKQGKDGKYYSYAYFPIDSDLQDKIIDMIAEKLK